MSRVDEPQKPNCFSVGSAHHQLLESHIEELRKKIDDSNAGIRRLEEYKLICCNELNSCNKELRELNADV